MAGDVFAGLRVIDATSGIAGPIAGMFLCDFGADVVKVEPADGDPSRSNPGFAVWNRGKRVLAVDANDGGQVAALTALVQSADVLITNRDTIAGVKVAAVGASDNPRLVHASMPAFLDVETWAGDIESEGLLAATTGVSLRQSSFSPGPVDAVFPILPTVQGVWAAASITAALIERERSGIGQALTVAGAHGAMVAAAGALTFDPTVEAPPRAGNAGGSAPFYRTYQCGDGEWLFLAALTPRFTDLAFRALDMVDIYDDERLGGRGRAAMLQPANAPWVSERIASVFASDSRDVWLKRLAEAGCPSGPSLARDDWLDHPQLDAIGMRVEVDDPARGSVVMPGVPLVLHATPGRVRGPAPARSSATGTTEWTGDGWSAGTSAANSAGNGSANEGPLAGVKVLDLGAIIAGPFAGGLLADLGADVIKVEPLTGDSFRGPGFASYNKGQRGIAIDLQNPTGRDVLLRLVASADLVIDNYRPGVLGRLRIDWSDLAQVNPDIVSISITGFGEGGPLGGEAGFDPVLQAMSGMMSAQGGDAEPVFFTVPVNDVTTAAATALGGLMGLLHRVRGGSGQKITTSLAAMSAFLQAGELVRFDGRPPARIGSRDHRGTGPLDRYYEASDGWVRVHAAGKEPEALRTLGLEPGDDGALATWIAARTRAEVADALNAAGIATAAARAARELAGDPNVTAFDMLRPDVRAGREHMRTTGRHARFSRTLLDRDLVAPALGEHSIEVLREAGYADREIDTLIADGVVGVAPAPAGA